MKRSGLTLVELLVVLVILAVLTSIAVTLTDSLVDQARFDATQRTLDNVQSAVLGPPNQTQGDGTPLLSGFLADIGRPPLAFVVGSTTPANWQMSELWSQGNLPTYGLLRDATDTEVAMLAGWRGPYLRMPLGNTLSLLDGWGNNFILYNTSGVAASSGDPVGLVTFNQSGTNVSAPYSTVSMQANLTMTTAKPSDTVITGSVIDTNSPSTANEKSPPITVKLFYPDISVQKLIVLTQTASPPSYQFTFSSPVLTFKNSAGNSISVPAIGNMVLRAYQDPNKSQILRLKVPPGGMVQDIRFKLQ